MARKEPILPLRARLEWAMARPDVPSTQAALARACGLSPGAVQQWFSGETEFIRPQYLFRAARALRVEAEWLGTGEGPRTALEAAAPDVGAEICRLVDALPQHARSALLSLLVAIMRKAS